MAEGETYHIFNRGAHKQPIFRREEDYARFLLLLHLANSEEPIDLRALFRKYKGQTFADILEGEKPSKSLVDIFAYSLMPNHFHLVLRQKKENGITTFARKVFTAYSMYFNLLYKHSGIISQGAFKSRHIDNDAYFRYIFSYVHLNPLSLKFSAWETEGIQNHDEARDFLAKFPHSSYYDYSVGRRPERNILSHEDAPDFLKTHNDLEELLASYKGQTFADVADVTKV